MITSLVGAQNPHVLSCTLRFLRSVRLVLKALTTINRGALNNGSRGSAERKRKTAGFMGEVLITGLQRCS